MRSKSLATDLAAQISLVIKALLVAGRQGAPAEGHMPFNPLYFHLLRFIDEFGPTRPSALAADLAVSRTTVSTAVKALQRRELLSTSPDETDGRAITVSLTDQGKIVVDAIRRQDRKNAEAMLSALSEDQREAFVHSMTKIAKSINQPTLEST